MPNLKATQLSWAKILGLGLPLTLLVIISGMILLDYKGIIDLSKFKQPIFSEQADIHTPSGEIKCSEISKWGSRCGKSEGTVVGAEVSAVVAGFPIPPECINPKGQRIDSTCPDGTRDANAPQMIGGKLWKMCVCI